MMDPPLCANGCGFYGSAENNNLCSKCYRDHLLTLTQTITESLRDVTVSSPSPADEEEDLRVTESNKSESDNVVGAQESCGSDHHHQKKNRCKSCNKKVGLAGFECRCGDLFCGKHRYPEEHSCTVDFKQISRQILLKQNPLVRADKLDRKL